MGFLIRLVVNAVALYVVTLVVAGVHLVPLGGSLIAGACVAALILGVVNALLRPLLILISLPLELLTLGLFTLVINALLFWLVGSWRLGLAVDGFWAAFWGAIVMSLVSWALSLLTRGLERR